MPSGIGDNWQGYMIGANRALDQSTAFWITGSSN